MKYRIEEYLLKTQEELERSSEPAARFALPAVQRLFASDALKDRNWPLLRELAEKSRIINLAEAALADQFPDVFHSNVAVSRREENRLYEAVLDIIERELG